MGLLDYVFGRTKIISYQISFGMNNTVHVHTTPNVSPVPGPEYIRLWAHYEAKIIYNLGFPNQSALMALGSIAKVLQNTIEPATDCFERAHLSDLIKFTPDMQESAVTVFTGVFFAKGSFGRIIQTYFPFNLTELQVGISGLALMQYAINKNQHDMHALSVLEKTARNFIVLYEMGAGANMQSVSKIPHVAYMQAVGLPID